MITRPGLGSAGDILYGSVIDTGTFLGVGGQVDCRDWASYLFNSGCWQISHSGWNEIGAAYDARTYPDLPTPVPPAAPATTEQMTEPGAWLPQQAISQTVQAQQQQNLDFFSSVSAGLPPAAPGVCASILGSSSIASFVCNNLTYIVIGGLILLAINEGGKRGAWR